MGWEGAWVEEHCSYVYTYVCTRVCMEPCRWKGLYISILLCLQHSAQIHQPTLASQLMWAPQMRMMSRFQMQSGNGMLVSPMPLSSGSLCKQLCSLCLCLSLSLSQSLCPPHSIYMHMYICIYIYIYIYIYISINK